MGDVREVLVDLITTLRTEQEAGNTGDYEGWVAFCAGVKKKYPLGYDRPTDGGLAPQYVLERLGVISGPDTIYTAGVGQHQMWAAHFVGYERPNTWINSGVGINNVNNHTRWNTVRAGVNYHINFGGAPVIAAY